MKRSILLLLLGCSVPVVKPVVETGQETGPAPDSGEETGAETAAPVIAAEGFSIVVHPQVSTILVARWTQLVDAQATWLSWSLDGRVWNSPERAREVGSASEVVLGLPAETAVELTLHVVVDGVESTWPVGTGTTGSLPADLVLPELVSVDETLVRPEPYVLTSVNVGEYDFYGPCYAVILDSQARVVWYRAVADSRLTLFPRVSRAGGYITWDATTYYTFDEEATAGVIRATLDLTQEEETTIPHMGLSYDELPDGTLLFDYNEDGYTYYLATQDAAGDQTLLWDCYDWMRDYDDSHWSCAPNTVLWNPDTNQVLWSMFETSTVASVDLESGTLQWYFGRTPGGLAIETAGVYIQLQHYPNWTPDGTLLLSTHVPGAAGLQMAREFEVDADAGRLTQVWSYSPDAGHYAEYAGEATRLSNGNTLMNFGTDGVVQEVTADGRVAWEIDWQDRMAGHLTPVTDLYALNVGW